MSTPVTLANTYTLVASFQDNASPQFTWHSSVDIHASAQPAPTDAIIAAMQSFWEKNLRNDCSLVSVELRAWTHGGPQPFSLRYPLWVHSVAANGTKNTTYGNQGAAVGGEVVAFCHKLVSSGGKPGKFFIRALLDSYELLASAGGRWTINNAVNNVTVARFHSLTVAGVIDTYFGTGKDPGLVIVHGPGKTISTPFSDPITDVVLAGVGVNKQTRKNKK